MPPTAAESPETAIYAAATLSGYTAATFGATERDAFKNAIASSLDTVPSAVTIDSVANARRRRRGRSLLQSGNVLVPFTVATSSASAAASACRPRLYVYDLPARYRDDREGGFGQAYNHTAVPNPTGVQLWQTAEFALGGLLLQVFEIHVGKELVIVIVILLEQSLVLGRGGVYGRLRD